MNPSKKSSKTKSVKPSSTNITSNHAEQTIPTLSRSKRVIQNPKYYSPQVQVQVPTEPSDTELETQCQDEVKVGKRQDSKELVQQKLALNLSGTETHILKNVRISKASVASAIDADVDAEVLLIENQSTEQKQEDELSEIELEPFPVESSAHILKATMSTQEQEDLPVEFNLEEQKVVTFENILDKLRIDIILKKRQLLTWSISSPAAAVYLTGIVLCISAVVISLWCYGGYRFPSGNSNRYDENVFIDVMIIASIVMTGIGLTIYRGLPNVQRVLPVHIYICTSAVVLVVFAICLTFRGFKGDGMKIISKIHSLMCTFLLAFLIATIVTGTILIKFPLNTTLVLVHKISGWVSYLIGGASCLLTIVARTFLHYNSGVDGIEWCPTRHRELIANFLGFGIVLYGFLIRLLYAYTPKQKWDVFSIDRSSDYTSCNEPNKF